MVRGVPGALSAFAAFRARCGIALEPRQGGRERGSAIAHPESAALHRGDVAAAAAEPPGEVFGGQEGFGVRHDELAVWESARFQGGDDARNRALAPRLTMRGNVARDAPGIRGG